MDIALNRHRRYRSWPGAARATLMLVTLVASPALAQSHGGSGTGPDKWKFTLAPYLMLPWMDGKTALRGHEVEVNVGPSQIFDNLQFSAMGYFEARGAKWGIGVDAVYMALGTDVAKPSARVDFNQAAYTTGRGNQQFKYDVITQAFVLGAAFHFQEAL